MKIDIVTLFPEMVNAGHGESMIGRARRKKGSLVWEIRARSISAIVTGKHHKDRRRALWRRARAGSCAEPLYLAIRRFGAVKVCIRPVPVRAGQALPIRTSA